MILLELIYTLFLYVWVLFWKWDLFLRKCQKLWKLCKKKKKEWLSITKAPSRRRIWGESYATLMTKIAVIVHLPSHSVLRKALYCSHGVCVFHKRCFFRCLHGNVFVEFFKNLTFPAFSQKKKLHFHRRWLPLFFFFFFLNWCQKCRKSLAFALDNLVTQIVHMFSEVVIDKTSKDQLMVCLPQAVHSGKSEQ